jgi:UDP-glucose 4-epimerase
LRVALVGGLGFIGKHLIEALSGSQKLVVLDSESAQKASDFPPGSQPIVEVGDITDGNWIKGVMLKHTPNAAVHLAALTGVKKCNENPSLAFSTNVLGTCNVIMGCVACSSKLIFISSREVYGETISSRTREDDPLVPNNVYGVTKMLGERLVLWAASKYNLDYTILRLTNVFGPGGDQYNIQAMVRNALIERSIKLLGGQQRMNLIYIDDVTDVIRRCTTDSRASRQTFNVGSDCNISVEEIVSKVTSLLDIPVKIQREPMRAGETLNFTPDLAKLEKTLSFLPKITFDEGLSRTIEWYRTRLSRFPLPQRANENCGTSMSRH